jgi:hypothetical protein
MVPASGRAESVANDSTASWSISSTSFFMEDSWIREGERFRRGRRVADGACLRVAGGFI